MNIKLFTIVFILFALTACERMPGYDNPKEIIVQPKVIQKETIIREREIVLRDMTETEKANLVNQMLNEAIDSQHCDTGDAIIFYWLRNGDWQLECGTSRDINQ